MNNGVKVCVTTVTYNRKGYMIRLLERLSKIEMVSAIYVFDNYSNDGTQNDFQDIIGHSLDVMTEYRVSWKSKDLFYFRNDYNSGGSGGFHDVVSLAMNYDYDFLWIMDDDVLPEIDCLDRLLLCMDDGHRVCVPNRTDDKYSDTAVLRYSLQNPIKLTPGSRIKRVPCKDIQEEMIDVKAMVFEGPLIDTRIVKKVGLPDEKYFIFFDDSDYCRRILDYTKVRLVKSAILHKQIIPAPQTGFGWRDYYSYRNCFVYDRKYGKNVLVRKLRPYLIRTFCMWNARRKFGKEAHDIIKIAYMDAINDKLGKTMEPGKMKEYLR